MISMLMVAAAGRRHLPQKGAIRGPAPGEVAVCPADPGMPEIAAKTVRVADPDALSPAVIAAMPLQPCARYFTQVSFDFRKCRMLRLSSVAVV